MKMKNDKIIQLCGIGAAAAGILLTAGFLCRRALRRDAVPEDGGVIRYAEGTPKTIACTRIVSFSCTLSTLAMPDFEENRIYSLSARRDGGGVIVEAECYGGTGGSSRNEFMTDDSFMRRLDEIIRRYDLTRFDGHVRQVSGLPEMYGAQLSVRYASGEDVWANDNEEMFLPEDAVRALISLFRDERGAR